VFSQATSANHIQTNTDDIGNISDRSAQDAGEMSTGSSNNLDLGGLWLRECLQTHSRCPAQTNPAPTTPYRVIDVGPPDGSQLPYLSIGRGRQEAYAALSYCWGKEPVTTTTARTLEQFRRQIIPSTLPKTIQDAIHVTRSLSLQFLWVDSLCIVQDSKLDWEEQAALMSDIYRNALVTVSANVGDTASSGLFVNRNPLTSRPCRLRLIRDPSTDLPDRLDESLKQTGKHVTASTFARRFESSATIGPLESRAWVLQEKLLSLRTLEFTPEGLHWHCLENYASEEEPGPKPPAFYSMNDNPILSGTKSDYSPPDLHYGRWYSAVEWYNARSITYSTDKLPALSGLAAAFLTRMKKEYPDGEHMETSYLAGLWRDDLVKGLMWTPDENVNACRTKPPVRYIAPSWSWASLMDVKISFFKKRPRSPAKLSRQLDPFNILGAETTVDGANIFGQVSSGTLRVAGLLRETVFLDKVLASSHRTWRGLVRTDLDIVVGMVYLDELFPPNASVWCLPVQIKREWPNPVNQRIREYNELVEIEESDFETRKMHIENMLTPLKDIERKRVLYRCLALISTFNKDEFRRIGIAEVWDTEWFQNVSEREITIV
jgi:hypothetical protein